MDKFIAITGLSLVFVAGSISLAVLAVAALNGIARNPDAADQIRGTGIILASFIELGTILALLICVLLIVR